MKKRFLSCLVGFIVITCSLIAKRDVMAADPAGREIKKDDFGYLTAAILPVKTPSAIQLSYVNLTEREKWILDEVLSDYVSEHVVELSEAGLACTIGDWIEREAYTCLFLEKKLPEGSRYLACGYAKTADGYVYFELSSSKALTEQQVRQRIEESFPGAQSFRWGVC
jgi:hypothetical protein